MAISPQMDETGRLLADVPAGDNAPPFSVSELSASLKRTVEDSSSGHPIMYTALS